MKNYGTHSMGLWELRQHCDELERELKHAKALAIELMRIVEQLEDQSYATSRTKTKIT